MQRQLSHRLRSRRVRAIRIVGLIPSFAQQRLQIMFNSLETLIDAFDLLLTAKVRSRTNNLTIAAYLGALFLINGRPASRLNFGGLDLLTTRNKNPLPRLIDLGRKPARDLRHTAIRTR